MCIMILEILDKQRLDSPMSMDFREIIAFGQLGIETMKTGRLSIVN